MARVFLIWFPGIEADGIIPNVADLCASFQYMVLHHLAKRIQRALLFCELNSLLPADEKVLVSMLQYTESYVDQYFSNPKEFIEKIGQKCLNVCYTWIIRTQGFCLGSFI